MTYTVEITSGALRQLQKLPADVQARLVPRIDALADNPRPEGSVKLAGSEEGYRIRAGDYRILYRVQDEVLRVGMERREKG